MRFSFEERTVILDRFPKVCSVLDAHLLKPDGYKIRTELLAVKLHWQKPVFLIRISDRAIDAEIARLVVMSEKLLYFKIIRLIERDELCVRQFNFSNLNLLLEI
ncbi:MAG TPA: hypothetical protein DDZ65_11935, partial [Firmicutes bacterium]|nr:hypothetical protein [Bacillota bacterium]